MSNLKISINIPCFNEENDIGDVVSSFKNEVPHAKIIVYDNCSIDNTKERAIEAGAIVIDVQHKGKGNVVRRIFSEVESDIYVIVDGDGTYDAKSIKGMIDVLISRKLDMVVGSRVDVTRGAYRRGHRFGNKALTACASMIFGNSFKDMLSGYRVFSRRFAKSFPAHSKEFEIETEFNIHALQMRLPVKEVETKYYERSSGSASKLRTYRDGWKILFMIFNLFRSEKPLIFYSLISLFFVVLSIFLGAPVVFGFMETGLVKKLPTAVLSAALAMISSVLMACGLILDSIAQGRIESKWQTYIGIDNRYE